MTPKIVFTAHAVGTDPTGKPMTWEVTSGPNEALLKTIVANKLPKGAAYFITKQEVVFQSPGMLNLVAEATKMERAPAQPVPERKEGKSPILSLPYGKGRAN